MSEWRGRGMTESGEDSFCIFGEKRPTPQAWCLQELHLDHYAPPSLDVSSL